MFKIIISCFILGLAIPFFLTKFISKEREYSNASSNFKTLEQQEASSKSLTRFESPSSNKHSLLDLIQEEILRYDRLEKKDTKLENQIKLAIFELPQTAIIELRKAISKVNNTSRFYGIMSALYARWAELDPAEAWASAIKESLFPKKSRESVLLTWLHLDREEAMKTILLDKSDETLAIITRHSSFLSQHTPWKAAEFVDSLFEIWPEADSKIFPKVAKIWAEKDPTNAAKWISTHWDSETKNKLLNDIAWSITKFSGRPGLEIVDYIEDPNLRKAARLRALDGWGSTNGYKFSLDSEHASSSIANGIPSDWSNDDIQAFSQGLARNYAHLNDLLLELATSEEQKQHIYIGSIRGAMNSEPALLVDVINKVNLSYLQSPNGQTNVTQFFKRWHEQSSDQMLNWVNNQPEGPRLQELNKILTSAQL